MKISQTLAYGAIGGFALGLVTAIAIGGTAAVAQTPSIVEQTYTACASEDSEGPCYWDAQKFGNHTGTSFLKHADGTITYLAPQP